MDDSHASCISLPFYRCHVKCGALLEVSTSSHVSSLYRVATKCMPMQTSHVKHNVAPWPKRSVVLFEELLHHRFQICAWMQATIPKVQSQPRRNRCRASCRRRPADTHVCQHCHRSFLRVMPPVRVATPYYSAKTR
jgi:hypothetical protein